MDRRQQHPPVAERRRFLSRAVRGHRCRPVQRASGNLHLQAGPHRVAGAGMPGRGGQARREGARGPG
ncbi:hypothetical protein G6F59_018987 [Rhizopus arrhizus]|nr:hypothetical protein G6F59_018987 [Rhizopus arrhizus]